MRIRTYRPGDIPTLVHIQEATTLFDGLEAMSEAELAQLLDRCITRKGYNVFLITDDDDELNTWGQGETLDGLQGEVVGYTILQLSKSPHAYHFYCHGTILPEYRRLGAGHALLLCAMNHARIQSIDFIAEARQQGQPIYFEFPMPEHDPAALHLARAFELDETDEPVQAGLRLYRTEL
jgi:ribosomal protein S18 acetylase RimI-like enzyme